VGNKDHQIAGSIHSHDFAVERTQERLFLLVGNPIIKAQRDPIARVWVLDRYRQAEHYYVPLGIGSRNANLMTGLYTVPRSIELNRNRENTTG